MNDQDKKEVNNEQKLEAIYLAVNGNGKIVKLLKNDVGATIALLIFLGGIATLYFNIKTDIAVNSERLLSINSKLDTSILNIKDNVNDTNNKIQTTDNKVSGIDGRLFTIEGLLKGIGFLKNK